MFTQVDMLKAAAAFKVAPTGMVGSGAEALAAWRDANAIGNLDQVNRAAALLATAARVKTKASAAFSYALKHQLESADGRYICNGAAILAAYLLGLKVWPIDDWGRSTPNAYIGVSRKHRFEIADAA
jgi:hypothetical protein